MIPSILFIVFLLACTAGSHVKAQSRSKKTIKRIKRSFSTPGRMQHSRKEKLEQDPKKQLDKTLSAIDTTTKLMNKNFAKFRKAKSRTNPKLPEHQRKTAKSTLKRAESKTKSQLRDRLSQAEQLRTSLKEMDSSKLNNRSIAKIKRTLEELKTPIKSSNIDKSPEFKKEYSRSLAKLKAQIETMQLRPTADLSTYKALDNAKRDLQMTNMKQKQMDQLLDKIQSDDPEKRAEARETARRIQIKDIDKNIKQIEKLRDDKRRIRTPYQIDKHNKKIESFEQDRKKVLTQDETGAQSYLRRRKSELEQKSKLISQDLNKIKDEIKKAEKKELPEDRTKTLDEALDDLGLEEISP